ncbi:vomeronasal type-1 receptor 90-like [Ctenodactylus gundi]
MNRHHRFASLLDIYNMFLFEVSVGILANTILLLFRVHTSFVEHRPKPNDLTIGHLALIHIVMLLAVGFISTDMFGFKDVWDDITCKSVIFLQRLMRGLSICTTCLLSVLQAITLSPRNSCLTKFKHKSAHHNQYCFLFFLGFNMFSSGHFLVSTVATPNVTSQRLMFITQSCSLQPINHILKNISLTLMTFRDVSFIALMALSSGYMVILLCRHTRQTRHLHSTRVSPKASPELRASQTILLLMSFFMVMYLLDYVITSTSGELWNSDPVHHCVQMLVSNGYATLSPLVLIRNEKIITRRLTPI